MKSQDILLLFKLISLKTEDSLAPFSANADWKGWHSGQEEAAPDLTEDDETFTDLSGLKTDEELQNDRYSVRSLARATGISKSMVALSLQRCFDCGLAKPDRLTGRPIANAQALREFIIHGIRYVFPAKLGPLTRGIATGLAAPVLDGHILTAGENRPVWPDPRGNTMGQTIDPLYKSVPAAVKQDAMLYALLAVTDAIRTGQPRERMVANKKFEHLLENAA